MPKKPPSFNEHYKHLLGGIDYTPVGEPKNRRERRALASLKRKKKGKGSK